MTQRDFVDLADSMRSERMLTPTEHVRVPEGSVTIVREYFGSTSDSSSGPQAFLVEVFPAESVLGAHFHPVDQFQVFFGARGAFYQRSPLTPDVTTVHYADASVTYGPFGTTDAPLAFFTLRADATDVTRPMPGSREFVTRRGGRNVHADITPTARLAHGETRVESVIGPDEDGLAVYVISAGPASNISVPTLAPMSAGQYVCVIGGTAHHDGRTLGERALGWFSPTAPAPLLTADGADGFEVLVMQFPGRSIGSAATN